MYSPEGKQDLSGSGGGCGGTRGNNSNNNNGTQPAVTTMNQSQMSNGQLTVSQTGTPTTTATNTATATPIAKWPIKPGVHLHVNGLHSLGKSVKPINGFSYGTKLSTSTLQTPKDSPATVSSTGKNTHTQSQPEHRYGHATMRSQSRAVTLAKMVLKDIQNIQFLLSRVAA